MKSFVMHLNSAFSNASFKLFMVERISKSTKPAVSSHVPFADFADRDMCGSRSRKEALAPARGGKSWARYRAHFSFFSISPHYQPAPLSTRLFALRCLALLSQLEGDTSCKFDRHLVWSHTFGSPPQCRARRTRTPMPNSSLSNRTSGARQYAASTANNGPAPSARSIARRST